MALYRYSSDSLIDEVEIVTNKFGGMHAYLYAREIESPARLATVRAAFAEQGWKTVPYSLNGKPMLEVRGFKNTNQLTDFIASHGWVKGQPVITKTQSDDITLSEKLRKATLRATGWVYNFGDISYMGYALKGYKIAKTQTIEDVKAAKLNIGAGIGYAIGGVVLSFFGSRDQSQYEIKEATEKMQKFLRKEQAVMSDQSAINDTINDIHRGPIERLKYFCARYPSEILNTVYMATGMLLSFASYKAIKIPQRANETLEVFKKRVRADQIDIGLGAVTFSSSLAGILIKEKKPIEGEPKRHGIGGVIDWIQEKPLRATGYGFMVATAFHAYASLLKWREGDQLMRNAVGYRIAFVASNVLAEILMVISSKGHGQGIKADQSVERTVSAIAADFIAGRKPEEQEMWVERLAGYLASPEVLGGKSDAFASEIRTQLQSRAKNAWAQEHKTPNVSAKKLFSGNGTPSQPATTVEAATIDLALQSRQALHKKNVMPLQSSSHDNNLLLQPVR